MALHSAENYLIRDAVKAFVNEIYSTVPLPDFDFHHILGESKLSELLQEKKLSTLREFHLKISNLARDQRNVIMQTLDSDLRKRIEMHIRLFENRRKHLESLSEKLEYLFCEGYRNTVEGHLCQNVYLDLDEFHIFLQAQKKDVARRFSNHWKPGDADFRKLRQAVFTEKLDIIQKDIEEKHSEVLQYERDRFSNFKEGLLNLLEETQDHIKCLNMDYIPIRHLDEEMGKIETFVDEQGIFGWPPFGEIHEALLQKIKAAMIGLCLTEEQMPTTPTVAWDLINNLAGQLKACLEDEMPGPWDSSRIAGGDAPVMDSENESSDDDDDDSVIILEDSSSEELPSRLIPCDSCRAYMAELEVLKTEYELVKEDNERLKEHCSGMGIRIESVQKETTKSPKIKKGAPSSGYENPHYTREDDVAIIKFVLSKDGFPGQEISTEEGFFEELKMQMKGGMMRGNSGLCERWSLLKFTIAKEGREFLKRYRHLFSVGNVGIKEWEDWERKVLVLASKVASRPTPTTGPRGRSNLDGTPTDLPNSDLPRQRRLFKREQQDAADIKRV